MGYPSIDVTGWLAGILGRFSGLGSEAYEEVHGDRVVGENWANG